METPAPPGLLLLEEPLSACPLTGEPIRPAEAEFVLIGPEAVAYDLVMGHSRDGARWYALLEDVAEIIAEEGWALDDVEGFAVNGRRAAAGLWSTDAGRAVPWEAYRALAAQARERAAEPPPPPEAVRRLPVLPEVWEVATRGASWIHDEEPPRPAYLAVVVAADGRIRANDLRAGSPHDAASLAGAVRKATHEEPRFGFAQGRPRAVRVADAGLAGALAEALEPSGIPVEAAAAPLADEALDGALAHLGPPLQVPLFLGEPLADLRTYFAAAKRFYRARPWQRLRGDRYVAFRLGDGPWLYANVMGQMEEEPGLSLFDSWLRLCRFVHNEPTPFDLMTGTSELAPLEAAGAIEGVTLFPLSTLLPEDGAFLLAQGLGPVHGGLYPLPVRYTAEGLTRASFPPPYFSALLEGLVTTVAARRARQVTSIKQTVEAAGLTLTLRYPARGDEHFEDPAGAYRLIVDGRDAPPAGRLPAGSRIEVEAPGDATLAEVHRALHEETGSGVWFSGFGSGDAYLWHARNRHGAPSPRVADLHGLPSLWLEEFDVRFPLQITRLRDGAPAEITVRRLDA